VTDTPDKNTEANVPDEGAATNVPDDGATRGSRDPGAPIHAPRDDAPGNVPGERASFDDDRLLAYALGLKDDAELEATLAEDETLRRRLEALQAGLDDVGAGLERLVSAPDDTYADPAAARWDGLRPFFAPPPERPPARGSLLGRWRVLVPVLGAVLAVAIVGAFALRDGPINTQRASDEAGTAAESAGAPNLTGDATKAAYGARELAADLELYETAVVARAGQVSDGRQQFTVVRQIKGTVTGDVYLEVVDQPVAADTLTLVMFGGGALGEEGDAALPTPAPTAPEAAALQRIASTAYLDLDEQGVQAVAIPLPPDVDLDELLP
jgi:hypothetical protein